MTMKSIRLLWLTLLLSTGQLAVAAAAAAQTDGAAGAAPAQPASAAAVAAADAATRADGDSFHVGCVRVYDRRAPTADAGPAGTAAAKAAAQAAAAAERAGDSCSRAPAGNLVGTGDVEVGMSPADYAAMRAYEQTHTGQLPFLYLNGVLLSDDARLVGIRQFQDTVFMRYNIVPGTQSSILWSALYRTGATAALHPLGAAIGFDHGPLSNTVAAPDVNIAITSPTAYHAGLLLVAALVGAGLVLGYATDIFRTGSLPAPLQLAAAMKLRAARDKLTEEAAVLALDSGYTADQRAGYETDAGTVLAGGDPAAIAPARLAAGLYLLRGRWKTLRSCYSLSRVQLGAWTVFAVAAGAYLWVIYGDLPDLQDSLLILLGLSAATTTLALATDSDNPNVRFGLSQGFLRDLVTGWDDKQQLHRFQAVIVNVLLLIVGGMHVYTQLAYPIFSPNWLTLLGISGLGLAAGKKYVEGQPETPPATKPSPQQQVEDAKRAAMQAAAQAGAQADAQVAAQVPPQVPGQPPIPVVARGVRRATDTAGS